MSAIIAPTMGRPKKSQKSTHVRLYEDVAFKLRIVSQVHGIDTPDAFVRFLGPILEREYAKAVKLLEARRSRTQPDAAD